MNYGKKHVLDKEEKLSSKKGQVFAKLKVISLRLLILAAIAAVIGAGYYGYTIFKSVVDDAPEITAADVKPSGYTTFVVDANGNELQRFVSANANRIWANGESIPQYTKDAFVAIEDSRFYEHNGIDPQGIVRAFAVGVSNGLQFSEGASTITQQLIKNTIYPDFVNEETFKDKLVRKIQEQYLALELEKTTSKDEILENYLNTINLGQNTLGIQTAAKRYFGKNASELTLSESATLAAITQNPSKYNPITHPEYNAERRQKVLDNMLEQEMISKAQYDEAVADNVYERIQLNNAAVESTEEAVYTFYIDELTEQVIQDLQDMLGYSYTQAYNALYSGGLTITACQDAYIQAIVDEEMNDDYNFPDAVYYSLSYASTVYHADGTTENYSEEMLLEHMRAKYGDGYSILFGSEEEAWGCVADFEADIVGEGDQIVNSVNVAPEPQASVVIMDQYTGEVKAISGGRGSKNASLTLNRATNTTRQPGSCFKVLSTYAPAMDACGYTLATTIEDSEFYYDSGTKVKNWWGDSYKGNVTVRKAIEQSMNVVAVKTLTDITPRLGYNYLLNFGFTTLVDNEERADGSVVSDVVQPLALGGITYGITNLEITAAYAALANEGIYTKPRFYSKILDHEGNVLIDNTPDTHQVVNQYTAELLTDAMQDVITQGTGTTAQLNNMPVAGKTGTTTDNADIWLCAYTPYYTCSVWGGFDGNQEMSNTTWHMVLWRSIMERVSENQEYKEFEMSPDITECRVCSDSGLRAGSGCSSYYEYFAPGTEPQTYCTDYDYDDDKKEDSKTDKTEEDTKTEEPEEGDSDDEGDEG